jgi:DNA replication protein DnaC
MTTELKNVVESFLSQSITSSSGTTFKGLSDTEIAEREAKQLAKEARIKAQAILADAKLPTRNADKFESTHPKWNRIDARLKARLGDGFIIALLGPRGTGKTQLGCSLCQAAAEAGRKCLYGSAMGFFLDIKESFDGVKSEKAVIDAYVKPAVLVLDEMQERGQSQWEDRLLTHLIDRRYSAKKDTLLLSNQSSKQFQEAMGESVVSRILQTGGIAVCDWESFRIK